MCTYQLSRSIRYFSTQKAVSHFIYFFEGD
jgi:hypothetical protein